MLAENILQEIRDQLHDASDVRWTRDEKLRALNFAQKMLVIARPDAKTLTAAVQLAAGATKQALPADGHKFIRLTRNMGADGASPGKTIQFVDLGAMNVENEDWHTATAATVIQHYLYDNTDPLVYYVYPAAHASTAVYVELVYGQMPTDVPVSAYNPISDVIGLPDIYEPPLYDLTVSRLFLKSTEAADVQQANTHLQLAYHALGVKTGKDNLFTPESRQGAHNERTPRPESIGV